jgi:hypothetical protein
MVMVMDDTWLWLLNATWLNSRRKKKSWNIKNQIINIIMNFFLVHHATIQMTKHGLTKKMF